MNKKNHIYMPEDHMNLLYNSKNPLVRFVHKDRLKKIAEIIPKKNGLRILDAGCGEGHLIHALHSNNNKNNYYGIDITDVALKRAKEKCPYANLKNMNLTKLNVKTGFFDIIICSEVLEHIYEYEKVIKELKRVLKKQGYLIITFPNEDLWTLSRLILMRKPIKVPDHVNSFSPKKIKDIVNLKVESQRNLPFYLPFFLSLGCLIEFVNDREEEKIKK